METVTDEKVDIRINPFLTLPLELIRKINDGDIVTEELKARNKDGDGDYIVPNHEFAIISSSLKGKREIVWIETERNTYIGKKIEDLLYAEPEWKEVFVWDFASIELKDSDPIILVIDWEAGCNTTNIHTSLPFIREIAKFLEKSFPNLNLHIKYETLYTTSFVHRRKPLHSYKKKS